MEKYEIFTLNKTAQEKLEKHNLKHIFDEERELYSIVSINPNKDGKIDHDGFYVALNKEDEINKNKQFAILVESNVVDEDVDLTIRNRAFNVKHFDVDTIFSDIKDPSEFLNYNEVERDYDLSIEDYPYYSHKS